MVNNQETFLPQLAQAFEKVKSEDPVSTRGFAAACDRILPIFDHLGTVSSPLRRPLKGCMLVHEARTPDSAPSDHQ